jgi:hypothetical protein
MSSLAKQNSSFSLKRSHLHCLCTRMQRCPPAPTPPLAGLACPRGLAAWRPGPSSTAGRHGWCQPCTANNSSARGSPPRLPKKRKRKTLDTKACTSSRRLKDFDFLFSCLNTRNLQDPHAYEHLSFPVPLITRGNRRAPKHPIPSDLPRHQKGWCGPCLSSETPLC